MNDKQVKIVRQLLEWHIENLIDEPDDSPRGEECRESQALFDLLYVSQKVPMKPHEKLVKSTS